MKPMRKYNRWRQKTVRVISPRQPEPSRKTSWLQFFSIRGFLEFAGFCIAVWALMETVDANRLTRSALKETQNQSKLTQESNKTALEQLAIAKEEIEENRIINAWQILAIKSPGNSGKIQALEALGKAGQNLRGIDLSCQAMGIFDWKSNTCETGVYLYKVSLGIVDLTDAKLSFAEMSYSDLSGAILTGASLTETKLGGANLSNAILTGANLNGAILKNASLRNAQLFNTQLKDADLSGADLSNAKFCLGQRGGCARFLSQEQVDKAWAWKDMEPLLGYGLKLPQICDPIFRSEYEEKGSTGRPKNC